MRKLFILSLLIINSFNLVYAQELVLSDRIREAREAAKQQQIKEKVSNIKPVNIKDKEIILSQKDNICKKDVNIENSDK